MFLPTIKEELDVLGWERLDVILVTGDSYVDSPFVGVSVIGKLLVQSGYRVGIIAQPDVHSKQDIVRLGEPALFWGVSGGCVDSMVANYTATKKRKKTDDMTPGGTNDRRPDRAVIAYSNLIRRYFKETKPIVLGGVEASLRRIAHYDFWADKIRRAILFDAKADFLLYGMAERSVVELANALAEGSYVQGIRGLCYIAPAAKAGYVELPSFQDVAQDKLAFVEMFHTFYANNDPLTAEGLCQRQDTRYLIQNPPAPYLTQKELDGVYAIDFERSQHPFYESQGQVKALETTRFSIATHRGCYGECNFCSIAVHQGRTVRWRSQASIVAEAQSLAGRSDFKGYIQDVGGPTANMYGFECDKKLEQGSCAHKRCLYPEVCGSLNVDHSKQLQLLRTLRQIEGVKKVFIGSGIRYDLILDDAKDGGRYLREVVHHHVSGQLKVAPEHTQDRVLNKMGKPGNESLIEFKQQFDRLNAEAGKDQFLTYYLIAAHPGCSEKDMKRMRAFISRELQVNPEQVQIFTPTPATYSSVMYYTEIDPFTGESLFVEKENKRKQKQKNIVLSKRR
ncbi:MAG: YgiQ family radical SAM protein [Anaerolineae bacterium]|nr:YgiQ family radical SAM protein [Anaerolineae bacterium]